MSRFSGKRIAVVGLSVEGRDSVKYFVQHGASVTCCDRRSKETLGDVCRELSEYNVTFAFGKRYLDNLASYTMIVRTPGMSPRLPELIAARRQGVQITSLTKIFFEECKAPIIGVTGTKGKGTTSTLIYEMLLRAGKKAYLGGNVGSPLLSIVDTLEKEDIVVVELSSFQLEDLTQSPHIAVVLAVTVDHLANYDPLASNFHTTRDAYVEAKKNIVRFQTDQDTAILAADEGTSQSFLRETHAQVLLVSRSDTSSDAFIQGDTAFVRWKGRIEKIASAKDISIRGLHNLANIATASLAALVAGATLDAVRSGATGFGGLEHRLEFVRKVDDVSYFNDSFSTVPETAIAAIESFTEPLILILGGSEKGSDFSHMGNIIAQRGVKAVIVIGAMTARIVAALHRAHFTGKIVTGCRSMHEVLGIAVKEGVPGDIVILTPACASFDMFVNYKERGMKFKYEVSLL